MKNMVRICLVLLLGIAVVLVSVSCSSGISQSEYDGVLDQLADAQDEIAGLERDLAAAKAVETEGVESSLKYQDLKKDYDAVVDELETLQSEHTAVITELDEVKSAHEILQAQNESNLNQINLLQTEKAQLQAQLDALTPPFPAIATGDIEQALFEVINGKRTDAGLVALRSGKNLVNYSRINSEAMSVAKQNVIYDDNWVPYQLHFIAGGYDTLDDIIDAVMLIWQSNALSYQNNILADDAIYGAVGVVETGGIFYITYMSSDYP